MFALDGPTSGHRRLPVITGKREHLFAPVYVVGVFVMHASKTEREGT